MFSQLACKGTGVPLIFLHGFLGCRKDWDGVLSHLHGRTCFVCDLPGHGDSPWCEMNIVDLMECALPPGPLALVGYSLGGRLAMRFALKFPARIHSLTLLSTHHGLSSIEEQQKRLQDDRIWAQRILTTPFHEFLTAWYNRRLFASLQHKPELLAKVMLMRSAHPKPKDLARALMEWSLGRQPSYREQLRVFAPPAQILYGEKDTAFAVLYQGWPQAHAIAGAGHALHLETPKKVAEYL